MRQLDGYYVNTGEAGSIEGKLYVNLACDSTETKPTSGIADGSIALETDTGKLFVFNEHSGSWVLFKTIKE